MEWIQIGIEKKNIRKFKGTQNEFQKIEIYETRNLEDQIQGMKYTGQHKRKTYLKRIYNQGTQITDPFTPTLGTGLLSHTAKGSI